MKKPKSRESPKVSPETIRDRIKSFRRVEASLLRPSPRNWRSHPKAQREALQGILTEIGYADVLLTRELPDGSLELIDGHLRAEMTPDTKVPVLVLDVTEEEAAKLLACLDPLASLAEVDKDRLESLLKSIQTGSEPVKKLIEQLAQENRIDSLLPKPEDPGPQIGRAAELQKKWGVKSGDLFLIPSKTVPPRKVVRCPHCDCENEAR